MYINLQIQFGTAGVADAGARRRIQEGPVFLRHLMVTPTVSRARPGMSS